VCIIIVYIYLFTAYVLVFCSQNIQKHEPARTMSPISENKWKLLGSRKTVEETFRNSHRISMLQGIIDLPRIGVRDRCGGTDTILGRISVVSDRIYLHRISIIILRTWIRDNVRVPYSRQRSARQLINLLCSILDGELRSTVQSFARTFSQSETTNMIIYLLKTIFIND